MSKLNIKVLLKTTIIACSILSGFSAVVPPEIQKCKSTDNSDCIAKAVMDMFKYYPHGNPEIGLQNISALTLTDVVISESMENSPVQINFKYNSFTVSGMEKSKVLRVSGFDKVFKNPVEIDVLIPNLDIQGDYESTGKILMLPINGKGKGRVLLKDALTKTKAKVQLVKRNDKTYIKIKTLKVVMEPKQMIVNMENIFNGNPTLSDSINSVVNENWQDVWTELKNGINNAIAKVVTKLSSNIIDKIPLEEFYID